MFRNKNGDEAEKTASGDFVIRPRQEFHLTIEDIDDIMAAALEGGINYWCCKAEVVEEEYLGEFASEQIARGGSLRLYDAEEDEQYILTLEKFLSGMAQLVSKGYDEYHSVSGGKVDTCEIDADIADRIIQLALFDDVIFG